MGSHQQQSSHQAMDPLVNLFTKASHDLTMVLYKLQKEFRQIYPDNTNPMKLIQRIKKLQDDVSVLKEQCRELLSAKQDLVDQARTTLVGNRNVIQRMNGSLGIPAATTGDSDDALANFNQVIDEWTAQVQSSRGAEEQNSDPEDINKLLFSAIVENN